MKQGRLIKTCRPEDCYLAFAGQPHTSGPDCIGNDVVGALIAHAIETRNPACAGCGIPLSRHRGARHNFFERPDEADETWTAELN